MKSERNLLLDIYRIIAVLMVLTVHVNGYLSNSPDLINNLFGLGAYGVALYFVLSGFFAYPSIVRCDSFREYFMKKIVRILPMYYISLFFTFIVGWGITKEYPVTWEWLYHIFFLNMFIPSKEWMWWNSVNFFWTMPAFMAWYVVSYLFFKKVNDIKGVAVLTLISVVVTPLLKNGMRLIACQQFVNWNFFCLLYVFLFGSLACFVIVEEKMVKGCVYGILIAIIGLVVGNRNGFFVFGLLFYFLIILTSTISIRWNNIRFNKIIKILSNITYSTYLTHWFILKLY